MALESISSRAALTLPLIGIGLSLANWNARPDRTRAWAAGIVVCLMMLAVRYGWQRALRRSLARGDVPERAVIIRGALARIVADVNRGVVFGAVMVVMSLAVALAHTYGFVDGPGRWPRTMLIWPRTAMIISGLYVAVMGNTIPKHLPPAWSMQGNAARIQAFHRLMGWTWALCGLGIATPWLVLPLDAAKPVSLAAVAAGFIVTIVSLVRLRKVRVCKPQQHAPGLN